MRPDATRRLLDRLISQDEASAAADRVILGMMTALTGAGGFGKTTLARMLVHHPAVRERFSDGIVWITLGETVLGSELADRIDDACAALTGIKPPHADPVLASAALEQVLRDRNMLLVVDDAWVASQVQPFLFGGPTVRLITTRQHRALPADAIRIDVDAMTHAEAADLLTAGLGLVPPRLVSELLELTWRWPLLLSLVNGAARADVEYGADVGPALTAIRDELGERGVRLEALHGKLLDAYRDSASHSNRWHLPETYLWLLLPHTA